MGEHCTDRGGRRRGWWRIIAAAVLLAGGLAVPGSAAAHHAGAAGGTGGDVDFSVARLAGPSAAATAAAVSARFFAPGAPAAFVTSSRAGANALAIGPVAARVGGPVLYVSRTSVPDATISELARLRPRRIYVIGDTAAVSEAVRARVAALSAGGARRISGRHRYHLAARLSATFFPTAPIVYVATGEEVHDALAGGPAAAVQGAPMLLVQHGAVPDASRAELARLDPGRIMLIGSTARVSTAVEQVLGQFGTVERIAGDDAATTAAAVARRVFGPDRPSTFLTTGASFHDAAAAVSPAGRTRGPILWARATKMPAATAAELVRLSPRTAFIVGGEQAVGVRVAKAVQRLLGVCWVGHRPAAGAAEVISSVPTAGRRIALTFDMGGRLVPARDIVAYLAANQVCATFFPTGAMTRTTEGERVMRDVARRQELFEVANHTMHHCDLVRGGGGSPTAAPCDVPMTAAFIRAELTDAAAIIRSATGLHPAPYWRPPYSSYNSFVLSNAAAVGYTKTIQFNRDTIDWDPATTTNQLIARVVDPLPPDGSIVLFHLGGYRTLEALPWIVTVLRDNGYTLTTVSDLLD